MQTAGPDGSELCDLFEVNLLKRYLVNLSVVFLFMLAVMEPIHVIPTSGGTDVFFDVTNAGYHHHFPSHTIQSHGGFWPSHTSRTISDHRVLSGVETSAESSAAKIGGNEQSATNADQGFPTGGLDRPHARNVNENTSPRNAEGWKSGDEDKRTESEPSDADALSSPKETQVAATLKWLSENYELSEGVCLPRCVLYVHYLDLCKRQGFKPAGAATFGKLIRQRFKNITTRRLGTRGQSKYHYYGIGIKESSAYYQSVYTGKGLTRFSGIKIKTEGSCRKYSLSSKTGTLLPEFPDAHNLILPDEESTDKMNTFIMMYRTHSQRILDTVITSNFEEIQNLLVHFWQGYPQHLQEVLHLPVMCDVVAICDSILYKVLTDVLVPNAIQDLPESLSSDLRAFLKSLPHWMQNSLDDILPENVRKVKSEVLQQFIRSLTRQLAFIKMAQTARPQMATVDVTNRALNDLDNIDFDQMCVQTSFAVNDKSLVNRDQAKDVFEELKNLLRKQSQIESYTEWIDSLIDKCVLQSSDLIQSKFQERAKRFLLQWTMFGALVMKDLTLNNARSFSFLHVMKMTLDEYILLVMETQTDKLKDQQLQQNLQRHMKNAEEIKMNAKIRTQANKLQTSPKSRKRKTEAPVESGDEIDATDTEENCSSFHHAPSSSIFESASGTAFSRPLPSHPAHRETSDINFTTSSQCRDMLRPSAINHNSLPLSPIKHFPSYERPSLIPTFSFNSYSDYMNHANNFAQPRQVQTFPDHTPSQQFHPMNFNHAVNSTHPVQPTYWTDTRSHHTALSDPYTQHGYSNYQQTYDAYKKNSLFMGSAYQDSLTRSSQTFDGLSMANATLDGLTRTNQALDGLARSNPSFDAGRPAMYYAPDRLQVASSLTVGSYANSFMEITPSSGQYSRQDGLLYQEDMFASNMAAASGFTEFAKSYFPASFR